MPISPEIYGKMNKKHRILVCHLRLVNNLKKNTGIFTMHQASKHTFKKKLP